MRLAAQGPWLQVLVLYQDWPQEQFLLRGRLGSLEVLPVQRPEQFDPKGRLFLPLSLQTQELL